MLEYGTLRTSFNIFIHEIEEDGRSTCTIEIVYRSIDDTTFVDQIREPQYIRDRLLQISKRGPRGAVIPGPVVVVEGLGDGRLEHGGHRRPGGEGDGDLEGLAGG